MHSIKYTKDQFAEVESTQVAFQMVNRNNVTGVLASEEKGLNEISAWDSNNHIGTRKNVRSV